ncbi:MAG: hypothetical protein ABMB14_17585 [Myxococcota bacterium]
MTMSHHLSTLTLHLLRYGELDGAPLAAARDHLDRCESCAGRLAYQERERAAFVVRPMPEAIRALGRPEHAEPAWRRWLRDLAPFAIAAAAGATLFTAIPTVRTATTPGARGGDLAEPIDQIVTRGELPAVEAWIDAGAGPRLLRADDVLGAGHRVQLAYDPHGASYVALAGRDDSGEIEVYTTGAPTGIGLVRAPFALTLDGAPGDQELFVIGSDLPLEPVQVKAAVATGVPGVRVARVVIHKQE